MTQVVIAERSRRRNRSLRLTMLLVIALLAAFVASLSLGVASPSIADVAPALFGTVDDQTSFVINQLRLPRAITGAFVGGALGLSGAFFQSMVRNPLASPDVIGITAGASALAVLAIAAFDAGVTLIALAALAGAGIGAAFTYGFAFKRGRTSTVRIVLVGIGVAAGFTALMSYALVRANIFEAAVAQSWLAGSLNGSDWTDVTVMGATVLVGLPLFALAGWRLRAIELGDDIANLLGAGPERSRASIVFASVVLAGISVSVAGPVAFVAFVAAPIARQISSSSTALVASAIVGAVLVVSADLIGRLIVAPSEIPVGVLTAFVGAPYLLWLLTRMGRVSGA